MTQPLWSILIASVPSRKHQLSKLEDWIEMQILDRPIELLTLYDNKRMSVGRKRNLLLDMAQGRYLSFIDDDDTVADNYVEKIYETICDAYRLYNEDGTERATAIVGIDVFCFKQLCTHVQDGYKERCSYSLKYAYEQGRDYDLGTGDPLQSGWWRGLPSHTMVLRSELAKLCRFPEKNFGEDIDFCKQFAKIAKTEVQISETLYFYNMDLKRSETRG